MTRTWHTFPILALVAAGLLAPGCSGKSGSSSSSSSSGSSSSSSSSSGGSSAGSTGSGSSSSGTSGSGSSSSGGSSGGSTSGGEVDAGVHAEPPAAPAANPGDGTGAVTFAISHVYLGDTDPDGTPDSANGWTHYGYDLDGLISDESSTDLCQPSDGASPRNVYPDGEEGRDNGYGHRLLPIVLGLNSSAETDTNNQIAAGQYTTLISIDRLGAQASYQPLTARLYDGSNLGATPKFDGSDVWPVTAESVVGGDVTQPVVSFPSSYLAGNTWVSGTYGTMTLALPVTGGSVRITLKRAVITMELDPSHTSAAHGLIAGVMTTADISEQMRQAAGAQDPSLCSGPTIDSIRTQIRQTSDILADGTQDPSKTCDGISLALGFDARVVQLGAVATPVTQNNPCP